MKAQTYQRGVLYAVLAGVFLSTAGLIVRFVEFADVWTVLFYRSLAFTVTVIAFMAARDRRALGSRFQRLRPADLCISLALALSFIFYVLSLFYTSVANTVLLLSTGPIFAAVLGWFVLGESVDRSTWVAMVIAIAGVGIMVAGEVSATDLLGMGFAVAAVLAFAIMIVALRHAGPGRDSMAATALAGVIAALVCMPFIRSFDITPWDLLMSISLGSVQIGVGFILITLATRSVPSAQVPLFSLSETALAPLWVWWVVNETPVLSTLAGGAVVLSAVLLRGVVGFAKHASDRRTTELP